MMKRITFDENELQELLDVLKLSQPKGGFNGKSITESIGSYFQKYYKTELSYVDVPGGNLICTDRSTIRTKNQTISIKDIINELIYSNLMTIQYDKKGEKTSYYLN